MLNNTDFTLLTKAEYLRDLAARIAATDKGDRVLVVTHDFRPEEPMVSNVVQALSAAARRGVQTHFAIDERSFPVLQRIPLTRKSHRLIRDTNHILNSLKAAGAVSAITNKSYNRVLNRFSGRAHIKLGIINNTVYIGGCNLTNPNQIDIMLRWDNAKAAHWLRGLMEQVLTNGNSVAALAGRDRTLQVDDATTLLVDAGVRHQSIILEHALRTIDEAREWIVVTCQFFPSGVTARHLTAAHKRGVDVRMYFNHPATHQPGINVLMHVGTTHERTRQPGVLFAGQLPRRFPFMHAKLLATEQSVMLGSHNYMPLGVRWGTAESALLRRDPALALRATAHFLAQLDAARQPA